MASMRLKWLGYLLLIAALPLAILAGGLPVNEYKAQGIDGVDCDGPLQVLFYAVPALLIYGTGLALHASPPQKPFRLAIALLCAALCLFAALNAAAAVREQWQQGRTAETCSRGL
ncbi:hypothetical protein EV217_0864 [Phyllobacterium myrsinacearum]|uniref:hypothetical protein n=1 Tax=Phyllobacterium myrsinacearum TaxID=28101 RepID=UPI0010EF9E3C|nr:hypothetical protein EV217_0864 [Phyllobacterium myrsinacearum]